MDKKGFLKIMEAIIAIIVVFGVVLVVLPKTEKINFKMPPDLELMAKTILDDAQNDEEFRNCILEVSGNYPSCVNSEVGKGLGTGTLWQHAEKICKVDNGEESECKYVYNSQPINDDPSFMNDVLPKDKDIYTKSVTIKVSDVTAEPPSSPKEENKQLRIYFWSK